MDDQGFLRGIDVNGYQVIVLDFDVFQIDHFMLSLHDTLHRFTPRVPTELIRIRVIELDDSRRPQDLLAFDPWGMMLRPDCNQPPAHMMPQGVSKCTRCPKF